MPYPEVKLPKEDSQLPPEPAKNRPSSWTIFKHTMLFAATFLCVTFVGIIWVGQSAHTDNYWEMWPQGALFAALLLWFLATHEFGHYFAAVYHNVRVSLPYFIPIPIGIGTMGAVIRIKERIRDTIKLFDIGVAGPIAGFVVSLIILIYGFATLPDPTFMENFGGHEEIVSHIHETGTFPDEPPDTSSEMPTIILGNTILYSFIASFFDNVPPMYEMYHYPFLFAGWLGLFFTALNLTPIGQLDGGHILYSLIGYKKHRTVARVCFVFITALGGIEAIPFIYLNIEGWFIGLGYLAIFIWAAVLFFLLNKAFFRDGMWVLPAWLISLTASVGYLYLWTGGVSQAGSLIWTFWSFFLVYFVKMEHPPVMFEQELTPARKRLGWISMAVFILCISPNPIYFLD